MEEEVANLREKLEVSDMKNSLLSEECNKIKSQLEGLLHVKEVGIFVGIAVISKLYILYIKLFFYLVMKD